MRLRVCASSSMHTALARRGAGASVRAFAFALALTSVLVLAACGSSSPATVRTTPPTATATSALPWVLATETANASATAAISPLKNSPFVCANPTNATYPAGSSPTYAFVNADRQIYMVTGCSAPVQLTHLQFMDTYSLPTPVAWSPSHRYLAIHPDLQQDYCLKIVDTQTGAQLNTQYDCFNGPSPNGDSTSSGELRSFIGWLDDNTFLGRIDLDTYNLPPDPVRLVRVDIHSQTETLVKSFAWMANPELRAGFLFFAGRVHSNDTNAYLFRLSLADGSQAQLAGLGLSGSSGCQVVPGPCSWTAPWNVSPDGTHLLYHNPGADSLPSDTHAPGATPVYYANLDGSGAVQVLAGQGGHSLLGAQFDPTGTRVTAYTASSTNPNTSDFIYQPLPQGAVQRLAGSYYVSWRADGQAVVDVRMQPDPSGDRPLSTTTLITLSTQARTPLAQNTYYYLWAS